MLRFPVEMVRGHLIVDHEQQKMLLDTGFPVSVGREPACRFLDHDILLLQRYKGMTLDARREDIGTDIDVMIGTDVLSRYPMVIDLDAGEVVIEDDDPPHILGVAPLQAVGGIPVVEIGLGARRLRALLNTGVTLSFLLDVDTRAFRCAGVARECYPGLGEFATELRRVPLTFGDQPVTLDCGLLPSALKRALLPLGVHGVVGTNLLQAFRVGWGAGFNELHLEPRRSRSGEFRIRRSRPSTAAVASA